MSMIEKTKLNSIYGMFANHPYRNYADTDSIHCNCKPFRNKVKETIKIVSTGRIVKATITLSDKELEYIKNDELALKEAMEKRGKPNGNNIKK